MSIRAISGPLLAAARNARPTQRPSAADGSFNNVLADQLRATNAAVRGGDQAVDAMVETQGANLHETMIALEKADIAMRLTVRAGSLLVDAYREVSRMQI